MSNLNCPQLKNQLIELKKLQLEIGEIIGEITEESFEEITDKLREIDASIDGLVVLMNSSRLKKSKEMTILLGQSRGLSGTIFTEAAIADVMKKIANKYCDDYGKLRIVSGSRDQDGNIIELKVCMENIIRNNLAV